MNPLTSSHTESIIPDEMPRDWQIYHRDLHKSMEQFEARNRAIEEGMFAYVSWKWVDPLAQWIGNRKCLEVMAGRGMLTYALREKGVDIIGTDDFSWAHRKEGEMAVSFRKWKEPVTPIENLDCLEAVNRYGRDVDILIMSWPYMDNMAYQTIQKLYEVNPTALVVYIGERDGGCTADETFFDAFDLLEDEAFESICENYQRWKGVYDSPQLGRYKASKPK